MPWVDELRAACSRLGQPEVARLIGYSAPTISQVLNDKYPSTLAPIQAKVEQVLMKREVDCPMLGNITINVCRDHQARKLSTVNPLRVQMYRACRSQCPHSAVCKE